MINVKGKIGENRNHGSWDQVADLKSSFDMTKVA